jgi:hypothetical protein
MSTPGEQATRSISTRSAFSGAAGIRRPSEKAGTQVQARTDIEDRDKGNGTSDRCDHPHDFRIDVAPGRARSVERDAIRASAKA